jgi:hypothetical protein
VAGADACVSADIADVNSAGARGFGWRGCWHGKRTTVSGSIRLQFQQFDYFVAQILNFVVVGSEL